MNQRLNIRSHPTHLTNPYLKKIQGIEVRTVVKQGDVYSFIDHDSAEVLMQKLSKQQRVKIDTRPFTKVYYEAYPVIHSLSIPGLKVLMFVLSKLQTGQDVIQIDLDECEQACGYSSKRNVYNGIIDLLNKDMICCKASTSSEYFINVNYFFNGRRI